MRANEFLKLVESADFNEQTAIQIAKELHQNLIDTNEIVSSGSSIAAGNPHNVRSLRDDIVKLSKELEELGYRYSWSSPNYIKKIKEGVFEKWSEKYKRSISCNSPKGFSQRAHCQGRKKNEDASQ